MARISNYIGVVPNMGERFTAHEASIKKLMDTMHARGLALMDPGHSLRSLTERLAPSVSNDTDGHFPFLKADLVLGDIGETVLVERRLAQLEDMARSREFAAGYLQLTPGNLAVVLPWLKSLQERGITLVPLSYMIQRNTRTRQRGDPASP